MLVAEPPRRHRAERQLLSRPPFARFDRRRLRAPVLFWCACRARTRTYQSLDNAGLFQSHFWRTPSLNVCVAFDVTPISSSGQNVIQISSELPAPRRSPRCWSLCRRRRSAQSDDADPEMRIQQLEESAAAAHRPERGTAIPQPAARGAPEGAQGGAPGRRPAASPPAAQPNVAAAPPVASQLSAAIQRGYPPARSRAMIQQIAAPAPIVQEPPPGRAGRRGDAFDPSQNPNAPGAPRALGGGQLPVAGEAPVGAPGGRGAGRAAQPRQHRRRARSAGAPPPPAPGAGTGA